MSHAFAHDLKVARHKSGLTQSDCAHLLATQHSKISRIEGAKYLPTAYDIALLSFIYGKSYEALCQTVFENVASDLKGRVVTLPTPPSTWMCRFSRTNTLDTLDARLQAFTNERYGG